MTTSTKGPTLTSFSSPNLLLLPNSLQTNSPISAPKKCAKSIKNMDLSISPKTSNTNGNNLSKTNKVLYTTASGKTVKNVEEENKSGLTDPFTKALLITTWPMAKADLSTHVETYTKVNGSMIKHKEKVYTCMQTDPCTLASGSMTNSMAMASKSGLMAQSMKETFKTV